MGSLREVMGMQVEKCSVCEQLRWPTVVLELGADPPRFCLDIVCQDRMRRIGLEAKQGQIEAGVLCDHKYPLSGGLCGRQAVEFGKCEQHKPKVPHLDMPHHGATAPIREPQTV